MGIIKHFCHPDHPLKLVQSIEGSMVPNCDCCCEEMSFPGYACESTKKFALFLKTECKFYLHKSCAELAQEISHPLHPHPLTLVSEIPGSDDGIICDGCRYFYSEGFTYYCSWSCGFKLHPKCVSKVPDHEDLLQQQTFKEVTQLYHFFHKHALNFCNLRESNEKDCCCCKQRIMGSAYCCLQCKFFIHESCKEIPKQVQHPFHPQHLLLAQATDDNIFNIFMPGCNACKSSINGVRISCNMCNFHLHVSCANPNRFALKHKCHQHNMYYFVEDDDTTWYFKCNNCHEKCFKKSFYRCVECDFNLHLECIPIPSVVTVTQKHHHPLTLIDSIKEDNPLIQYLMDSNDKVDHSMDYYCDVCETPGNPRRHAYCCKECIYIAHVECAISEDNTVNTPPEIPSKMNITHGTEQKISDEADHITELQAAQSMPKKNGATSLDSKCMDNEELFSHPSHPHKLTLLQHEESKEDESDDETNGEEIKYCDGCNEVMCFQGYSCHESAKCKFYLHKSCSELPPNIQHPLHPHPLILLSEIPSSSIFNLNGIICDGCRNLYKKGFTYYCSWSCGFNLHPKCASILDHQQTFINKEVIQLYHFCHKHALNFCNLRESNEKDCCCCKQRIIGSAYCCLECGFFIHESCAEIPKQVQHPFHPQHLLLAQPMEVMGIFDEFTSLFSTLDSGRDCNACQLEIHGIKIGCIECSFNLHVSCANPNYRALEHKCHEHNMYYFVDNTIERFFKCDKCYERCTEKSFYRCVECDFNLHLECIPIPSVVAVTQKHHHPLTLMDSVKEDNPLVQYLMDSNDKVDHSMDYYCDDCETSGNPKHHAYCCKECIYIAHVECIISKECPPLEILQYLVPRRRHEAEQHNNIEDEVDESEKRE
ncbi:hypothetical protein EZV62_007345 [Acer yangbiense]|uniref:Zinc finger PHD-type domain-containing protein n=1 Tax=Acer yangbiense TaxID=1000413 RepID=A0A5C7I9U0_9ROSI|nr:hypothetical protein EZV62_007345 [Acer yangbiense]